MHNHEHACAEARWNIVQAGLETGGIDFPTAHFRPKDASFIGSFRCGAGDYETALELRESGKDRAKDLITHRCSFDQAEAAFQTVSQRCRMKIIIQGPDVDGESIAPKD